jgi:hypothetical protein
MYQSLQNVLGGLADAMTVWLGFDRIVALHHRPDPLYTSTDSLKDSVPLFIKTITPPNPRSGPATGTAGTPRPSGRRRRGASCARPPRPSGSARWVVEAVSSDLRVGG